QQMRLGIVRLQEDRPIQLCSRLAIVLLLEQSAGAIDMESRDLLLIALLDEQRALEGLVRELHRALHALEPFRDDLAGGPPLPLFVGGRQAPRELALARGFDRTAAGGQRSAEDEVCVAIG